LCDTNENIVNGAPKNGLPRDKTLYPKHIHEMEMTLNCYESIIWITINNKWKKILSQKVSDRYANISK
jgi:hypothetical protein